MATHSSVLAWRIPGMEEPGGLPSMGSPKSLSRSEIFLKLQFTWNCVRSRSWPVFLEIVGRCMCDESSLKEDVKGAWP